MKEKLILLGLIMLLLVLPMAFATDFTTNMKACWNWDGDATDDHLGNFDGTVTGATNTEPYGGGLGGGAYEFTGDPDGIAIGGVSTDFNMVGDTTTLFCYNSTQNTFGVVFGSDGLGLRGGAMRVSDTGFIRFADEKDGDPLITSTTALNNGDINCIVLTYEGTSAKLYINGILNGSDTGTLNNPSVQTYFGRRASGLYFIGWIGISAYWEGRVLNAGEITELETALRSGNICPTFVVTDTTPPIVNATLNKSITSIVFGDVINITANITDETGLDFCQVVINQTGINEIFNTSLSGTSAQCSNKSEVTVAAGNVINYTIRANDTSGNWRTNDIIITVADSTAPGITILSPINDTTYT
ncbi:hypothetical protein LCGC14_2971640, partial [marine sediment metagenome]